MRPFRDTLKRPLLALCGRSKANGRNRFRYNQWARERAATLTFTLHSRIPDNLRTFV